MQSMRVLMTGMLVSRIYTDEALNLSKKYLRCRSLRHRMKRPPSMIILIPRISPIVAVLASPP